MPIYFRDTPVNEPFTFNSIGNHWTQEATIRPKGYPLYHYLQTEKGLGNISIQGRHYTLKEGEGFLIAPYINHSYYGETDVWNTCFFTFAGTLESNIGKILGGKPVIFTSKEQGVQIAQIIENTIKKYEHPPLDAKALSVDCYRLLMFFADGVSTENFIHEPLYQRYVAPVLKEIESNYAEELTIQELSHQVFITPQYLTRLFQRFLGCSAYEYLTTWRMNKAKELLLTFPHAEVQEIARKSGFTDSSHFIAMFKKTTGMTPLEFRKLN